MWEYMKIHSKTLRLFGITQNNGKHKNSLGYIWAKKADWEYKTLWETAPSEVT